MSTRWDSTVFFNCILVTILELYTCNYTWILWNRNKCLKYEILHCSGIVWKSLSSIYRNLRFDWCSEIVYLSHPSSPPHTYIFPSTTATPGRYRRSFIGARNSHRFSSALNLSTLLVFSVEACHPPEVKPINFQLIFKYMYDWNQRGCFSFLHSISFLHENGLLLKVPRDIKSKNNLPQK